MRLLNDLGGGVEFTHYSWRRALRLASRYGLPEVGEEWFARSGHRVPVAEAALLSAALERALPDVPRHDAMQGLRCEFGRLPDVVWFSGPRRGSLRDLARFCRRGSFRIA